MRSPIAVPILILLLSACATTPPLPITNDPYKKLEAADRFCGKDPHPSSAERLIREAMADFGENGDQAGLAEAYRSYGFFLRSDCVEKWQRTYRDNGFQEPEVTWDNRFDKSAAFFARARDLFVEKEAWDGATNAEFNRAGSLILADDGAAACESYARTLDYYRRSVAAHPDVKPNYPEAFPSFEAYVDKLRETAGCGR